MVDQQNIKLKLSNPQDIVILSHRNPDGDAVGSSIGLARFLQKWKHVVKVIFPSEYPLAFQYLVNEQVQPMIYDLQPQECLDVIKRSSVIFLLDFNALDRIDKMGETVMFSTASKVLIDHHIDPEPIADIVISDTASSSTSELVFLFIQSMGMADRIDQSIGEALLTGIITDTGSFKYSTRGLTYRIAGELKEMGIDDYRIQNHIFNSLEPKNLKLLGHCLANRMVILPEYKAAYIYLTKEDYTLFGISRGDTEGIVNYLLMMKDISLAALITEQPTIIKISLRSKDDINVQQMASLHFNGGGHKNASGGSAYAKLDDVISRFVKVLPNYIKHQTL
ncbi:MAG: bifunctional oligoribonuclease/PAP phosphatase NrnA [Saprospiraceae bacterium]|nr:bifunctional oligoribonuclease/PAP phosphatase NrnA [Saprospiraceae bacterium]